MTINKILNSLTFGVFLSLSTLTQANQPIIDEPLIQKESSKEVILFFSLACNSCYYPGVLIQSLKLSMPSVRFLKVPVFYGDKWRAEARLYFLLNLSSENYILSDLNKIKSSYSISQMNTLVDDKEAMFTLLKKYGMKFTALEFSRWWSDSELMMLSAQDIINESGLLSHQIPSVRVYNKGKGVTYYDARDFEALLKQLLEDLK